MRRSDSLASSRRRATVGKERRAQRSCSAAELEGFRVVSSAAAPFFLVFLVFLNFFLFRIIFFHPLGQRARASLLGFDAWLLGSSVQTRVRLGGSTGSRRRVERWLSCPWLACAMRCAVRWQLVHTACGARGTMAGWQATHRDSWAVVLRKYAARGIIRLLVREK